MTFMQFFDEDWYLKQNPDVRAAVESGVGDAATHFQLHGRFEGRSPMPGFDPVFYHRQNPDIRKAVDGDMGMTMSHFLQHGYLEQRALSPFLDLGAYLEANHDVRAAVEELKVSPLAHLFNHGLDEGRDLGNGISLAQFANDPVFQNASSPMDALQRVVEVAPFLAGFQPPAGWEAPRDTPLPLNFVPLEGEKLVVPSSVAVPEGVTLPDSFEPLGDRPAFTAEVVQRGDDHVLVFAGLAEGDISMRMSGADAIFTRDGHVVRVEDFTSKVDVIEIKNGVLLGNVGAQVKALSLLVDDGDLIFPEDAAQNVLTYRGQPALAEALSKSLTINIESDTFVSLGNTPPADIGFYLSDIRVTGGTTLVYDEEFGDWFQPSAELESLYFGKGATRFDAENFEGGLSVKGYVSNDLDSNSDWEVVLGTGYHDLSLDEIGSGEGIALPGRLIDGGAGWATLELSAGLYKQWQDLEDRGALGDLAANPIIRNFRNLEVDAEEGMTYRSTLLGNEFSDLWLNHSGPAVDVTVGAGFDYVFSRGPLHIDATALQGDEADVFVWLDEGETASVRVAELDQVNGRKSGLGDGVDGRQSDVGVVVGGWDDSLDGVTFIVENMTLATLGGAVENDSLYLALYVDDREGAHDLAELITRFDVSQGDVVRIDEDQHYLNFEIEFDLNGAADGGEFNLVLSNVVTETEYQSMLQSLDPGVDLTLGLTSILVNDGSLFYW